SLCLNAKRSRPTGRTTCRRIITASYPPTQAKKRKGLLAIFAPHHTKKRFSAVRGCARYLTVTSVVTSEPKVLSLFLPPQPLSLILPSGFGSVSNGGTAARGQTSSSLCVSDFPSRASL